MTRVPPKPPAETPQMPTALWMYSFRFVEHVLEQTGIAVVVLGRHEDEGVRSHAELREGRVLDVLSRAGDRYRQIPHFNELGLDSGQARHLARHEPGDVLAAAPLPRCTQDDGDEERFFGLSVHFASHLSTNSTAYPSGSRTRNPLRKPSS